MILKERIEEILNNTIKWKKTKESGYMNVNLDQATTDILKAIRESLPEEVFFIEYDTAEEHYAKVRYNQAIKNIKEGLK